MSCRGRKNVDGVEKQASDKDLGYSKILMSSRGEGTTQTKKEPRRGYHRR